LARLGGDEFAVLQTSAEQPSAAIKLAQEIIDVVGRPMAIEGYDVIVSASIGIAVANAGGMSADNFLKCADIAMYGAKAKGPGNYRMFDPEMDAIVQARSALERDIRNGILHNHFRVFYQPLVNLRTREVSCSEALCAGSTTRTGITVRIHSAGGRDWFDRAARRLGDAGSMLRSDVLADDISVSVNFGDTIRKGRSGIDGDERARVVGLACVSA
jgi:predicted signal transduction protein with EAL and GGDEF domain